MKVVMCIRSHLEVDYPLESLLKASQICVVKKDLFGRWFWGPKWEAFSISLEVQIPSKFATGFGCLEGASPGGGSTAPPLPPGVTFFFSDRV